MKHPTPYIKTFTTPCGIEAEVWIDVPQEPLPVSVHTTAPASRETTAERRARQWIESEQGAIGVALELVLLGADQ
jgi:hypothetical protein